MEEGKVCFKCKIWKPINEFYPHPCMKDGHLNKCKECTKKYAREKYIIHSSNEEWLEKERERSREKFKRLGYSGKFKSPLHIGNISTNSISRYVRRRGYDTTGKEVHHWCYFKPHSVFLMTRKAHKRLHKHIIVNYEDGYNYTLDGVKIENVNMAKQLFEKYLKEENINEEIILIDK